VPIVGHDKDGRTEMVAAQWLLSFWNKSADLRFKAAKPRQHIRASFDAMWAALLISIII